MVESMQVIQHQHSEELQAYKDRVLELGFDEQAMEKKLRAEVTEARAQLAPVEARLESVRKNLQAATENRRGSEEVGIELARAKRVSLAQDQQLEVLLSRLGSRCEISWDEALLSAREEIKSAWGGATSPIKWITSAEAFIDRVLGSLRLSKERGNEIVAREARALLDAAVRSATARVDAARTAHMVSAAQRTASELAAALCSAGSRLDTVRRELDETLAAKQQVAQEVKRLAASQAQASAAHEEVVHQLRQENQWTSARLVETVEKLTAQDLRLCEAVRAAESVVGLERECVAERAAAESRELQVRELRQELQQAAEASATVDQRLLSEKAEEQALRRSLQQAKDVARDEAVSARKAEQARDAAVEQRHALLSEMQLEQDDIDRRVGMLRRELDEERAERDELSDRMQQTEVKAAESGLKYRRKSEEYRSTIDKLKKRARASVVGTQRPSGLSSAPAGGAFPLPEVPSPVSSDTGSEVSMVGSGDQLEGRLFI